jgi:hypothetical protein
MVGCFAGPIFPFGALEQVAPLAEADPGGVAAAIATFLESEEGGYWPQEGWQVLHVTANEILLANEDAQGGISFMNVSNDGSGWTWSGASSGGECPLEYAPPQGLGAVDWRLDPSGPPLTAESTLVSVLLTERSCVSGQEIGDRLVGPQVSMTDTEVRIAFAAEPPPGDAFDCQGNPETPYLVELPEPLGGRRVIEGNRIGRSLADYLD